MRQHHTQRNTHSWDKHRKLGWRQMYSERVLLTSNFWPRLEGEERMGSSHLSPRPLCGSCACACRPSDPPRLWDPLLAATEPVNTQGQQPHHPAYSSDANLISPLQGGYQALRRGWLMISNSTIGSGLYPQEAWMRTNCPLPPWQAVTIDTAQALSQQGRKASRR